MASPTEDAERKKKLAAAQKRSRFIKALITKNVRSTNAFVSHVNRLMSSTAGADRTLSFLYYFFTFLHPQLARLALLKTVKLTAPIPLTLITPTAASLATASKRVKLLASRVSDARMFLRLWGLFGMYEWGMSVASASANVDKVEWTIEALQVFVNTFFQIFENLAYLNSHNIFSFSKSVEGRLWLWSTRCWAAHITLEFIRLERVRARGGKLDTFNKSWFCNAAMAPLSVSKAEMWRRRAEMADQGKLHWSMEKGLISDTAIGALGGMASAWGLRDAWRRAAA